jgi:hypothetical protein
MVHHSQLLMVLRTILIFLPGGLYTIYCPDVSASEKLFIDRDPVGQAGTVGGRELGTWPGSSPELAFDDT